MVPYDMQIQAWHGGQGETTLDKYFSKFYDIEPVSVELQKMGIDRIFVEKGTNIRHSVEYKTDKKAAKTGNLFIESISNDTNGKLGWTVTFLAQVLIIYVPGLQLAFEISASPIKKKLAEWMGKYEVKQIPNPGYYTHGIPVPVAEITKICDEIHWIHLT